MTDRSSALESFRESLEDVVAIVEGLAPFCVSTRELLEMVKLAVENDGQLRLLRQAVAGPEQVKR